MALPLASGVLIDKFGAGPSMKACIAFVFLGQLAVAFGYVGESYVIVVLGRALFGIGSESLNIPILIYINKWFKGKELALAQGISTSGMRIASVSNSLLTPRLSNWLGPTAALWAGVGFCVVSAVAALALVWVDQRLAGTSEARATEQEKIDLYKVPMQLGKAPLTPLY